MPDKKSASSKSTRKPETGKSTARTQLSGDDLDRVVGGGLPPVVQPAPIPTTTQINNSRSNVKNN